MQPSKLIPLIFCCFSTLSFSQLKNDTLSNENQLVPDEISSIYSSSPNPNLSDNFTSEILDKSIWQYRADTEGKPGWAEGDEIFEAVENSALIREGADKTEFLYIEQQKRFEGDLWEEYISIRGSGEEDRGSGITSKNYTHFGFYTIRWSMQGISNNSPSRWHPSVWSSRCDFSSNYNCIVSAENSRIEIDFMEGFQSYNSAYWNSQVLTWAPDYKQPYTLRGNSTNWPQTVDGVWITMGLEYNPEYIRLWLFDDVEKTWTVRKTIPFVDGAIDQLEIDKVFSTPMFWILSNKPNDMGDELKYEDSSLNIDYFLTYDFNNGTYWPESETGISSLEEILDDKSYRLENLGLFLTLENSSGNGDAVKMHSDRVDKEESESQAWEFIKDDTSDYYYVRNSSSGLYLRCAGNTIGLSAHEYVAGWSSLKWRPRYIGEQGQVYFALTCGYQDKSLRAYDPEQTPNSGPGSRATTYANYENWGSLKWIIHRLD